MKGTVINRERSSSTRLSLLYSLCLSMFLSMLLLFLYVVVVVVVAAAADFVVVVFAGLHGSIAFQSLV